MSTPSPASIYPLRAFTGPPFAPALTLVYGAILAPGRRTVACALRAMGLGNERPFTPYHRVLNRAVWSPLPLSQILLRLIVTAVVPRATPLLLVIDDTLERRYGRRVPSKARSHDAVRSTTGHTVTTRGIRWLCVCALVHVPWSTRPWALPFLSIPCPTPAASRTRGTRRHRTLPDRAEGVVRLIRRWQPERTIVLVGESGYGVVALAETCRAQDVTLVARLRRRAALYEPVPPQPTGKPGVTPMKGLRLPPPGALLAAPDTVWATVETPWYGGETTTFEMVSDTARWHRDGVPPVPLRGVVLRDPSGELTPTVLFCPDQEATPLQIASWSVGRWTIEVTFEEARPHLGVETHRQWTRRAIERTTPCLFGLFSLVTLIAHALHGADVPTRQAAWYATPEATFAAALAAVRRPLWADRLTHGPPARSGPHTATSPVPFLASLVEAA